MTMLNKGSIHSQSSSFTGMLFQYLFFLMLISIEALLKKLTSTRNVYSYNCGKCKQENG